MKAPQYIKPSMVKLPHEPSKRLAHLLDKYPDDLVEDDLNAAFLEILRG